MIVLVESPETDALDDRLERNADQLKRLRQKPSKDRSESDMKKIRDLEIERLKMQQRRANLKSREKKAAETR